MEEHPSPEDLRRFVEGRLDRDDARRVVAHFLEGCRICGDEAVRYNLVRLSGQKTAAPVSNHHSPEMNHVLLTLMQESEMAPRRA